MLHQQGTRSPPPGGAGVPCPQCAHSPRGTSGPIHGPSPAGAPSTCSWRPLAPGTTDLGGAMEGLIHERRLDLADIGRLHLRLLSFETRPVHPLSPEGRWGGVVSGAVWRKNPSYRVGGLMEG